MRECPSTTNSIFSSFFAVTMPVFLSSDSNLFTFQLSPAPSEGLKTLANLPPMTAPGTLPCASDRVSTQQPHDRAARVLLGALGDRSSILGLGKGLLERLDGEGVVADV